MTTLNKPEEAHFKFLVEELLFRIKEDDSLLISDLEDTIKICAEILGIDPNLENDRDDY